MIKKISTIVMIGFLLASCSTSGNTTSANKKAANTTTSSNKKGIVGKTVVKQKKENTTLRTVSKVDSKTAASKSTIIPVNKVK